MSGHYHVIAGQPGCLPESFEIADSERSARERCREVKDEWRETFPDGFATGNARIGYDVHKSRDTDHSIPIRIYIEACEDPRCAVAFGDES